MLGGTALPKSEDFYLMNMEQFKVICVNDNARPKDFPIGCWITKGEQYTVSESKYLTRQRMSIGYKLAEIQIPEDCEYQFFLSNRFKACTEDDLKAEEAMNELLKEVDSLVY